MHGLEVKENKPNMGTNTMAKNQSLNINETTTERLYDTI